MNRAPEHGRSDDRDGRDANSPQRGDPGLMSLAGLFLKLGLIGFGGPMAHIAMLEDEAVGKRQWLSREYFMDLLAATNLVPGPNSTEMAIHVGYVRGRHLGAIVSGAAFILPAFGIVLTLSVLYTRYGTLPQAEALLYGVKPAVIAVILAATWRLGRLAVKDAVTIGLFGIGCAAAWLGVSEVAILLGAGVLGVLVARAPGLIGSVASIAALPATLTLTSAHAVEVGSGDRLWRLALFFLKVGAVLFGSGYVLVAFIEREVVEQFGWLTQSQLLDAIAIGQMTPGPVLTTATFIGYLVAGLPGAVVATLAIFAPSFVIVMVTGPWIPRLRESAVVGDFLTGVNAAVVALILVTALRLAQVAVADAPTAFLGVVALIALVRYGVDSLWLVVGGGLVGWLVRSALGS